MDILVISIRGEQDPVDPQGHGDDECVDRAHLHSAGPAGIRRLGRTHMVVLRRQQRREGTQHAHQPFELSFVTDSGEQLLLDDSRQYDGLPIFHEASKKSSSIWDHSRLGRPPQREGPDRGVDHNHEADRARL